MKAADARQAKRLPNGLNTDDQRPCRAMMLAQWLINYRGPRSLELLPIEPQRS
jgi:hypothetical protein